MTRGEFINAFSPEALVKLVTADIRHHIIDIKTAVYTLAITHGFAVATDIMQEFEVIAIHGFAGF